MLLWKITIKLFNEEDTLVDTIVIEKDFATMYSAEKYGIEQGQKLCRPVAGQWFLVEVE